MAYGFGLLGFLVLSFKVPRAIYHEASVNPGNCVTKPSALLLKGQGLGVSIHLWNRILILDLARGL